MAWPVIPPLMLVVLVLVLVAVAVVLRLRRGKPSRRQRAAEKLRASYAIGKMDRDEFEQQREQLQDRAPGPPPSDDRRPGAE